MAAMAVASRKLDLQPLKAGRRSENPGPRKLFLFIWLLPGITGRPDVV